MQVIGVQGKPHYFYDKSCRTSMISSVGSIEKFELLSHFVFYFIESNKLLAKTFYSNFLLSQLFLLVYRIGQVYFYASLLYNDFAITYCYITVL